MFFISKKLKRLTSVPKKRIPSALVIHYCAWYSFFRKRHQKRRKSAIWLILCCRLFITVVSTPPSSMLYVIRQSEVQILNIEIIHESVRKLCICTRQLFIAAVTAARGLLLLAATLMWIKIFLLLPFLLLRQKRKQQINSIMA